MELEEPSGISQVRLVFDPDLSEERCISVSKAFMEKEPRGVAETLVRDYTVEALLDGVVAARCERKDNHQRLNVVEFGKTVVADTVRVVILGTNGCENAHIYEIRIY